MPHPIEQSLQTIPYDALIHAQMHLKWYFLDVLHSDPDQRKDRFGFLFFILAVIIFLVSVFISSRSFISNHSKHPDPPSLPGSLRPASVRRSSISWTLTCLEFTPRGHRASSLTGRTSTSRRRTASPAYQMPASATTTPLLVWDWLVLRALCRAIPATTAAGMNMATGFNDDWVWQKKITHSD